MQFVRVSVCAYVCAYVGLDVYKLTCCICVIKEHLYSAIQAVYSGVLSECWVYACAIVYSIMCNCLRINMCGVDFVPFYQNNNLLIYVLIFQSLEPEFCLDEASVSHNNTTEPF